MYIIGMKFLAFVFLITSGPVWSLPSCYKPSPYNSEEQVAQYLNNVVAFDGIDTRQIEEDYAKTHRLSPQMVRDLFSPTGIVNCAGDRSSGQITLASNVVTTAGHELMDVKTCKKTIDPRKCVFSYTFHGKTYTIRIASAEIGLKCPPVNGSDWAVLTLVKPAVGPTPYKVNPKHFSSMKVNDGLVSVEALSADFCSHDKNGGCRRLSNGEIIYPKTISECRTLFVENQSNSRFFSTNCPVDHGASGGSLLDPDLNTPTLKGIFMGVDETDQEAALQRRTGSPIIKPSQKVTSASYAAPVTDEFLNAIVKATENNPF